MTNYLVFLGLGKLVIYTIRIAGILAPIWGFFRASEGRIRRRFALPPTQDYVIDEFLECGFCLGVWVFSFLAFYIKLNIFEFFPKGIISYVLTGIFSSFVVHLLDGGYCYHFGE